jgi:hypothetical protein
MQKKKTLILFSVRFYNSRVAPDGNSRSIAEHTNVTFQCLFVRVRASFCCNACPAFSYSSNWQFFPNSRCRTKSCNRLSPVLLFLRNLICTSVSSLATSYKLPNDSKPYRQLVTLTTAVAVPHYKTIHNRTVNKKVKQMESPLELAPPKCIYLAFWSMQSTPPIIALYSATLVG